MDKLVIFYSFTGKTRKLANEVAKETNAELLELEPVKKHGKLWAYTIGCLKAMKRKKDQLKSISADLNAFENIIILMPVWAGRPAPAFNNIINMLPSEKKITLIFNSAGSGTKKSKSKTILLTESSGSEVVEYTDNIASQIKKAQKKQTQSSK